MTIAEIKEVAPGCYVQQVVGGYELSYTTSDGGSTLTMRRPTLESLYDFLAHMNIQIPDLIKVEPAPEEEPYVSISGNVSTPEFEEPAELGAVEAGSSPLTLKFDRFDGRKAHFVFKNNGEFDVDLVRSQNGKSGRTLVKAGETIKRSWRADAGDTIRFNSNEIEVASFDVATN